MDDLLKELDSNITLDLEQIAIIEENEKNLLVVAGAGSGKTTTIVAKIKYLVKYQNISPTDILLVSFTNDTVRELRTQLWEVLGIPISIVTFHKLALFILEASGIDVDILSDANAFFHDVVLLLQQNRYFHVCYQRVRRYFGYEEREFEQYLLSFLSQKQVRNIDTLKTVKNTPLERSFIVLIENIETAYFHALRVSKMVDFNTMIERARKLLEQGAWKRTFQYIFVDEYQDISESRFLFVSTLVQVSHAYLIAVGDDWQSIFGFSGSKITLFHRFQEMIPNTKVYYLSTTYRNSQELITIAGAFIMKNKNHMKKTLQSSKHCRNPIRIKYYSKYSYDRKVIQVIDFLIQKGSKSIALLGRFQNDILFLKKHPQFFFLENGKIRYQKYPNISLSFFTIHASKGLGFDEVIILNMRKEKYGFPSNIEKDDMMYLLEDDPHLKEQEERRLCYVALTRTKHVVYLMVPYRKPSIYVKELKKIQKYMEKK